MCLASTSFFGQGGIPPPLWAVTPGKHLHYSEMQIDLEATHLLEDPNLRMASFTAAPHDPGCASAPSLWQGSRALLTPILPMLNGSGGMAGGCCDSPLYHF